MWIEPMSSLDLTLSDSAELEIEFEPAEWRPSEMHQKVDFQVVLVLSV